MHDFPTGTQPARPSAMRPANRLAVLSVLTPVALFAGIGTSVSRTPSTSLDQRERQVSRALSRAQFSNVRHVSSLPECETIQPPEALTTPDPLLGPLLGASERARKVTVSFIVGTDGRVHSPLILQSAGIAGDHRVLQTIRTWRYRPATCNGVPAETEGNVDFSSR